MEPRGTTKKGRNQHSAAHWRQPGSRQPEDSNYHEPAAQRRLKEVPRSWRAPSLSEFQACCKSACPFPSALGTQFILPLSPLGQLKQSAPPSCRVVRHACRVFRRVGKPSTCNINLLDVLRTTHRTRNKSPSVSSYLLYDDHVPLFRRQSIDTIN